MAVGWVENVFPRCDGRGETRRADQGELALIAGPGAPVGVGEMMGLDAQAITNDLASLADFTHGDGFVELGEFGVAHRMGANRAPW